MAAKKKTGARGSKMTRIATSHPLPDFTALIGMAPQLGSEFIGTALHLLAHATMTMALLANRLAKIELGPDASSEEVSELAQRIQTKLLRESYDYNCRQAMANAVDMVSTSVMNRT